MAELTIEQQRAIATASARARAASSQQEGESTSGDNLQRSMLVPMARNTETGENEWALPKIITGIPDAAKGIYEGLKSVVTAPGDAMSGDLQVMGPDGHVSPEAIARSAEFAATVSPMNPAVRAGDLAVPGLKRAMRPATVEPPTAQALKEAAQEGYESLRNLDARYSSQSISDMATKLENTLYQQGINDKTAPKTIATLRELQKPGEGAFATSSNIETIRRTFGKIGEDFANQTDRNAGKFARGAIDNFLAKPPDGAVLPGAEDAAAQAGRVAANARADYAASKRSGRLNDLQDAAELRAAAANSGQNLGNAIRSRAASVLLNPKASSGFTENELAAIRKVAEGTTGANITRYVGNLLGGGGGLGAGFTATATGLAAAASTGNPYMAAVGAAAPLAGAGSKQLSNIMTERALRAVDAATRKRSPLYQQMLRDAPMEPVAPVATNGFLRSLLLGAQGEN
ncbi:hypothetical protein ACQZ46_02640 [Agrobacterium salinitolerans]